MTRIIEVHGLKFSVDCGGFSHAERDRDEGLDAIEAAMVALNADEIARIHAADLTTQRDGGERAAAFDRLETIGHAAATNGWRDASKAYFSITAMQ